MFLHVEPSNNFGDIKKRIAANFNMDASHIMLLANDKVSIRLHLFTYVSSFIMLLSYCYMTEKGTSRSGHYI